MSSYLNSQKKIGIIYNKKNFTFQSELDKPIYLFFEDICSYLKINSKTHTLSYNNQEINLTDKSQLLSNILKNHSEQMLFKITQKTINYKRNNFNHKSIDFDNYSPTPIHNDSILSNNSIKTLNNKSVNIRKPIKLIKKVNKDIFLVINQIPSFEEVKKIFNDYYIQIINSNNNNDYINQKGVLSLINKESVRIDFPDEIVLNDFISYLSYIKYMNKDFKNINFTKNIISHNDNNNISIINNNYNKNKLNKSHKNINLFKLKPKNSSRSFKELNQYMNTNNTNNTLNTNNRINYRNDSKKYSIRIKNVLEARNLKEKEHLNHYHGLSLSINDDEKITKDFYQEQPYLRNSSPYLSPYEIRILEEKENKKKFFKHLNFIKSVGKYSMKSNYIENYVSMTPSENPNDHKFRSVNKKRWITEKGFLVA